MLYPDGTCTHWIAPASAGAPCGNPKYARSYFWVHWPDSAKNQVFGGAAFMISAA